MKRRRTQRKPFYPSQNLDSFLDVLTNTVGVLMFMGLFVALVAAEGGKVIRTPMVSQTQRNPRFFEVRGNRVVYINDREIAQQVEKFYLNLPRCEKVVIPDEVDRAEYDYYLSTIQKYNDCLAKQTTQWDNFRGDIPHYQVKFVGNSLIYEPLAEVQGEDSQSLKEAESEFVAILTQLDPERQYLAFIVRPDSFEAFRAARQQAWALGFKVGWEPHSSDNPLVFGTGGRSIGVQ